MEPPAGSEKRPIVLPEPEPAPEPEVQASDENLSKFIREYLLPDFNWERTRHLTGKGTLKPHILGPTSRERMEHARSIVKYHIDRFNEKYKDSDEFRILFSHPYIRVTLYRIWLARPRPFLWDPSIHDLESQLTVDQIPDKWDLPSDKPWRRYLRNPPSGLDYILHPDWYRVGFLETAYFNHHLEFTTHCFWRTSLRPDQTFRDKLDTVLKEWPITSSAIGIDELPDPGPNPGLDFEDFQVATTGDYLAMMLRKRNDALRRTARRKAKKRMLDQKIDRLDRSGYLVPGLRSLITHSCWQLEISDDSTWVFFPGAELLVKRNWTDKRLRPLLWLRELMIRLSRALARTELIRVPSINVYFATHGLWTTEPQYQFAEAYDPFNLSQRARMMIMVRPGDPGLPQPRHRRVVFFDAPVRSATKLRIHQLTAQVRLVRKVVADGALVDPELRGRKRKEAIGPNLAVFDGMLQNIDSSTFQLAMMSWHPEMDLHLVNLRFGGLRRAGHAISAMFRATEVPDARGLSRPSTETHWRELPWRMVLSCLGTTVRHRPFSAVELKEYPNYPEFPKDREQRALYLQYLERTRPNAVQLTFMKKRPGAMPDPKRFVNRIASNILWQTRERLLSELDDEGNEEYTAPNLEIWAAHEKVIDAGTIARIRQKLGAIVPNKGQAIILPARPWDIRNL